ncbi:heat-inducible transcriptional repressor HrcA [Arthrobacter sp. Sr24]
MSEPRRLEVLRAIVEDYVHSREPVGSKALVERHHLGVSSATIRNDMAALEEEGLITAPHTSSGRIPTDKGYRLFVDQLASVKPLSAAERRAISVLLDGPTDLDDVLERTVRTLAQLTNQVAVVQYPRTTASTVRHIEFVSLAAHRVLVVLILASGKVEQNVIDLGAAVDEEVLANLRRVFMASLNGLTVAQLPAAVVRIPLDVPATEQAAAARLAQGLALLAHNAREDRIVMAGTANLARSNNDFPLSIGPVLDALEEQVVLLRLLEAMAQDSLGMAVVIGRENPHDSLAEASVVATSYVRGENAKLGVVGPTRMDYPNTMASVRAVAQYLSRILAG